MSTEHNDLERANADSDGRDPEYPTRDFYLACFLRCVGYELVDLRPEGRRKVFVFRDRPVRREDVMAFYGEGGSVRPLANAGAIKDMKALLYNA